jgi:hypothetical protein
LNRAGYSVTGKNAEMVVNVSKTPEGNRWIVSGPVRKEEFGSVYDLVSWLTGNMK